MNARSESFRTDGNLEGLRVPPQSIEAEQAVIGALLLAPESLFKVQDLLTEHAFYRRDHRLIYRGIRELARKGQPFDAVTLGEWFEASALADQIGGAGYLIQLASTTPSAANVRAYAEIVREKSLFRQMIDAGTDIVNMGFNPDGATAIEILGQGQAKLGAVLQAEPCELETTGEVLRRMTDEAARRYELGGELDGLSTGLEDLDALICGLKGGQLIVVAGRPKQGKTTLAMNIAEHVAVRLGKRVAVHSLEMRPEDLLQRSCCSLARVPHNQVRRCETSREMDDDFTTASRKLAGSPLLISRPRNVRIEQLVAQTRRAHAEKPLALVVIDYLQLIDASGAERRDLGIAEITRQLKLLAVTLDVPVILLSQLNRNLEARPDKRPIAADLRDGGSIEQDADVVLFVYRDETYHPKSADRGTAEVIVGLQRGGPTGMARLRSRLDICRFETLEHDWEPLAPAYSPGAPRGFRRPPQPSGKDMSAP